MFHYQYSYILSDFVHKHNLAFLKQNKVKYMQLPMVSQNSRLMTLLADCSLSFVHKILTYVVYKEVLVFLGAVLSCLRFKTTVYYTDYIYISLFLLVHVADIASST